MLWEKLRHCRRVEAQQVRNELFEMQATKDLGLRSVLHLHLYEMIRIIPSGAFLDHSVLPSARAHMVLLRTPA